MIYHAGAAIFFEIGAIESWISKSTFDSNIGAPTCLMIKNYISRRILIFEVISYRTPNQNLAWFVLSLKIINTFMKKKNK